MTSGVWTKNLDTLATCFISVVSIWGETKAHKGTRLIWDAQLVAGMYSEILHGQAAAYAHRQVVIMHLDSTFRRVSVFSVFQSHPEHCVCVCESACVSVCDWLNNAYGCVYVLSVWLAKDVACVCESMCVCGYNGIHTLHTFYKRDVCVSECVQGMLGKQDYATGSRIQERCCSIVISRLQGHRVTEIYLCL